MKLHLEQNITHVDISNIRVPDDIPASSVLTPEEMIYFAEEEINSVCTHHLAYFELDNCECVFKYLDAFEDVVPKRGKRINWDWAGIRKNNEYFIAIYCFVSDKSDTIVISRQIQTAFHSQLAVADRFDFPEVNPSEISRQEEVYCNDEYDDDAALRLIEECSFERKWIRWERSYPETEGDGSGLSIGFLIDFAFNILTIIIPMVMKWRIKRKRAQKKQEIRRLKEKIIKKCSCKGHIRSPKAGNRTYTNAKTKKKEYLFYEILDNGAERQIFISIDGKDIRCLPFKQEL